MKQKVMITGIAGFVGSNLARMLLDLGYEVIGIDNLSSGTLENVDPRARLTQADIRDESIASSFQDVDCVFHLAARSSLNDCHNHPRQAVEGNVQGTLNVLECAKRARVRKFIYADTSAEYEGVDEFPSRVERTSPRSIYARTKAAGASLAQAYAELFGLRLTILRYFNVYGPAQDWRRVVPPVMSAFILKMLNGERPVIYGTGEKRRDFIYVDDVNRFHSLAMNDPRTDGKIFNVGSGANFSVIDVFERVERILKTGLTPIYKDDLPSEAQVTLADISASRSLGWVPQVALERGLLESIAYLQEKVLHESVSRRI